MQSRAFSEPDVHVVGNPRLIDSAAGPELHPRGSAGPGGPAAAARPARGIERGGPRVAMRVLDAGAHVALVALVGAVAWLAAAAAAGRYTVDTSGAREPSWVAGPLRGLASPLTPTGFGVALLVIVGAYLLVLARARSIGPQYLIGAIVGAHVAIALAPPILSADVFGYIDWARLGTVHHLNPYLHAAADAPSDPIQPFIYWKLAKSPYGPLFTLATYPLVSLGPQGMLWALKGLAAAASLGVVALVWRGAVQRGLSPVFAAALVGLNPFTVVYAVGGAHNDLYWLLMLTAAAVALGAGEAPARAGRAEAGRRPGVTMDRGAAPESGRSAGAGALVAVACALKLPAVMVAPYLLAGTRRRGAALLGMAGAGVAVAGITVIAFGAHPVKIVSDAFDQKPAPFSGPYWLARLLSVRYDGTLRTVCIAAAAVVGLAALAWTWRRRGDPRVWIAGAGWTILAATLALASFEPWYVVWVLPFAALAGSRVLRAAAIVLTLAVVAIHMPLFGYIPAF